MQTEQNFNVPELHWSSLGTIYSILLLLLLQQDFLAVNASERERNRVYCKRSSFLKFISQFKIISPSI